MELVNKRINAAKQAMQGGQKGRNNTEYPLMMAAFEMGKKVLDVEIPECVQLPFFVQWYEEWERDKLGQGQPSFPKRDMLAGENSPTYINIPRFGNEKNPPTRVIGKTKEERWK